MRTKLASLLKTTCSVVGAVVAATGVAGAAGQTALKPNADVPGVHGWWPGGNHFPLVAASDGSEINVTYPAQGVSATDEYEMSSTRQYAGGGHFSATARERNSLFPGVLHFEERKGSSWLHPTTDTTVPKDGAPHSFSPALPDQSIVWNQSELDNTLCIITGNNAGDATFNPIATLYVDKVNFVVTQC
jgi:hypothetical protein